MKKGRDGEDFVNQIAYRTFLQFWCYPNPLDITKDNKEICDLLIVFDSTCIIISVKNYDFKDNYSRYFRNTTEKAIKQISGAERRLFGDRPILLKHPDRDAEYFDKNKITDIIRIVVNLNEDVKYYQTSYFLNNLHYTIMDASAWEQSISEMNTIPDFVDYIKARCNLFDKFPSFILPREEYDFNENDANSLKTALDAHVLSGNKLSMLLGTELDLIATYIKNMFSFPSELTFEKSDGIYMKLDGEWEKYKSSKLQEKVNDLFSESYFIDKLGSEMLLDKKDGHKVAKLFFSLNRMKRAALSKIIHEYHTSLRNHHEPIEYNRRHVIVVGLNLILMYFIEEVNKDELHSVMNLSMVHHAYLNDFNVEEIGLLAISKNMEIFIFGYSKNLRLDDQEMVDYIKMFEKLNWKIK